MNIEPTFKSLAFNRSIIIITLIFSLLGLYQLLSPFENINDGIIQNVVYFIFSLFAFISLVQKKYNPERYTRIFITVVLIIPGIIYLSQYIMNFFFDRDEKLGLFAVIFLFFKLILGLVLLKMSIFYSKQRRSKRLKDIGVIITIAGVFIVSYVLVKSITSHLGSTVEGFTVWEFVVRLVLGLLLFAIGLITKYKKADPKSSFWWGLAIILVYFIL